MLIKRRMKLWVNFINKFWLQFRFFFSFLIKLHNKNVQIVWKKNISHVIINFSLKQRIEINSQNNLIRKLNFRKFRIVFTHTFFSQLYLFRVDIKICIYHNKFCLSSVFFAVEAKIYITSRGFYTYIFIIISVFHM